MGDAREQCAVGEEEFATWEKWVLTFICMGALFAIWGPAALGLQESKQIRERDRPLHAADQQVKHAVKHVSRRFAGRTPSAVDAMRFMERNDYARPSAAWPSAWGAGGVLEVTPGRVADELHIRFGAYPSLDACQRAAAWVIRDLKMGLAATPACSAETPHVLEVPLHFSMGI